MAIEKKWPAVAPQLFTSDGGQYGIIKIASASGFKVKQRIVVSAIGQPQLVLQVKRIIGPDTLVVGPLPTTQKDNTLTARTDLSAYTVILSAYIYAEEQDKAVLKPDDILQAVYDQEPAVALRSVLVDEYGRYFSTVTDTHGNIRLAVDAAVTIDNVDISLDALTPPTKNDPDNVLIAGSEDGTKGGLKHAARVDSALDLRVGISYGANKAIVDAIGRVSVSDADVLSALEDIFDSLELIEAGIPAALGQTTMANSMPVTIASDQSAIPITGSVTVTFPDEPLKISGTENGQPNGPEFTFVNNVRSQILAAKDRDQAIIYADFGTRNQRITQIDYTAPSIGSGSGFIARKSFIYTLVGTKYRRDNIIWSIV